MLLRIQREESLRSFIARNIYANSLSPATKELKRISKNSIVSSEVLKIGKAMGWLGCYGMNRLLHNHTFYPRFAFLHENEDISYSESEYVYWSHRFELAKAPSRFCPECVRDDIAYLGFSYWRRVHHPDINVCAKHNVYLEAQCPFCSEPSYEKNGLDVMWKGCKGLHLSGAPSRKNLEVSELKKAEFFRDVFNYESVISVDAVRLALTQRAVLKKPHIQKELLSAKYMHECIEILKVEFKEDWIIKNSPISSLSADNVWAATVALYEGFDDFINHVKCYDYRPRKVESLWSTYEHGTYKFAQYIQEDYVYGVGHWSSTLSSKELIEYRGEPFGRPRLYPCCNDVPPFYQTGRLQPTPVGWPPPSVPILAKHPSEY